MHIEFLVEDSSGRALLDALIPKLIGPYDEPHRWRTHSYKGVGRLPRRTLARDADPNKRLLLDQLPRILRGYGRTPGIDAIVVVLDSDRRDCVAFLNELSAVARQCGVEAKTLFRLAIEEIEAWYFGDKEAVVRAYPGAKRRVLDTYVQDSVCGTWEVLADAVFTGGVAAVNRSGGPNAGDVKHEWARRIGPLLDPERNASPSFGKLRDGLRRIAPTVQTQ